MSYILYDDSSTFSGPPRRLESANATERWLAHFSNSLILTRMEQVSSCPREKAQIAKEMRICDRKMAFWKRHPRYLPQTAQTEALRLRAAWAQSTGDKK